MRLHMTLPEQLIADLDAVVDRRQRSAFIESAIREKLAREKQRASLRRTAGILRGSKSAASSPEMTAWVRALREKDESIRPARSAR